MKRRFYGVVAAVAVLLGAVVVSAQPTSAPRFIPSVVAQVQAPATPVARPAQDPQPVVATASFVAPNLMLQGTGKYDPDEYVNVNVTSSGTQPKYLVSNSYDWRVWEVNRQTLAEREVRVNIQNDRFTIHSPIAGKTYQVECIVVSLYVVRDGDRVTEIGTQTTRLRGCVEINGTSPGPGPGPNPPPNPPPPPPSPLVDGRFKLAKTTYDIVMAKAPAERRQEISTALAASFRSVYARIGSGQPNSLGRAEDVLRAITESNDATFARLNPVPARAPWRPAMTDLETALFNVYSQRQINNLTDWRDALEEIATGFAAVR